MKDLKTKKPQKGRTSITDKIDHKTDPGGIAPQATRSTVNRPVSAGAGHRGDRRDMSPTYSGTTKHASRGSDTRPDVKTRKR